MSRRYVKELAIESGTPLGIVPGSNYAKALNRDSVVKVISRDMNMVGDDLRRSENRVYAEYIVKNGKKNCSACWQKMGNSDREKLKCKRKTRS